MPNALTFTTLICLVLCACSGKEESPKQAAASKAPPALTADVATGRTLVDKQCAGCHGLDGRSTAPDIPHLAAQRADYLTLAMHEYKDGARVHAALHELISTLSDKDVIDIAGYFASLPAIPVKPAKAPVEERDPLTVGKEATAACAGCHGDDGNAVIPGTPSLAGQQPGFLKAAIKGYQSGTRKDAAMKSMVAGLKPSTVEAIATYYTVQTPKRRSPSTTGNAKAGEPLSGVCGGCHGANGNSSVADTPSLAGQDPEYLTKAIKEYRDGKRKHDVMRGVTSGVSDADAHNIAAFYVAQEPKGSGVSVPLTPHGWAERCDRCHGAGVHNPTMVVPRIAGQRAEYLAKALAAYRDGKRKRSEMHSMTESLSDADIQGIATYYAGMVPK
ncbi:MAG: c-type cytochrome [Thiobacillaceae bacterium]